LVTSERGRPVALAPTGARPAQARGGGRARLDAEACLARAMEAETSGERAHWAERGLGLRRPLDRTTRALLLRQLYLARYAERDFRRAYALAEQAAALGVLPDVMHQDAARAKQAQGEVEAAVGHLRLAARLGPPSRRAFHYWTLGSVLFLARRHDEAITALGRAARWGRRDKPLYQGHLALAKCAAGQKVRGLGDLMRRLARCPAGQGYGRFVLGQLAYQCEDWEQARSHLAAFVARTTAGRATLAIALEGELALARRMLASLDRVS
jgi:tetratricopeptide (TPR) repeat protein